MDFEDFLKKKASLIKSRRCTTIIEMMVIKARPILAVTEVLTPLHLSIV